MENTIENAVIKEYMLKQLKEKGMLDVTFSYLSPGELELYSAAKNYIAGEEVDAAYLEDIDTLVEGKALKEQPPYRYRNVWLALKGYTTHDLKSAEVVWTALAKAMHAYPLKGKCVHTKLIPPKTPITGKISLPSEVQGLYHQVQLMVSTKDIELLRWHNFNYGNFKLSLIGEEHINARHSDGRSAPRTEYNIALFERPGKMPFSNIRIFL